MSKEELIPFQIQSLKTKEFATIKEVFKEGDEVGISTGYTFGLDKENKSIAALVDLSFDCNKVPFILLKVQMEFKVESKKFESFKNKKKTELTLPNGFLAHLAAISISTARGILHEKLKGTQFDYFLLPAINVASAIKDDMKFKV